VFRVARDGWAVGQGEEDVDDTDVPAGGFDWTGFVLSFKGVSLEGLEVAVIVVAFGAAAHAIGSAIVGAAAAVLAIGLLGAAGHRLVARIPRRALQLFVGVMLTTFGTYWSGQGLSVAWPGDELSLLWLGGLYLAGALLLVARVRRWLAEPRPDARSPTS
jgi:Ca2+/H+ antiporter, TMEM165/GDT1 family